MTLSKKELEIFNRDGFLLLRGFLAKEETQKILEVAQKEMVLKNEPIESEGEYLEDSSREDTLRRLRQVYQRDKVFSNWMKNPEIKPILNQVLGEAPIITLAHHNSIMTKMPNNLSSQTDWHQDIRYWHFNGDNLVSVWLALDYEHKDNGVLEFIPESHKREFGKESFDEKLYFLDNDINRKLIDKRVSFELNSGDVVLFHAKTLHRADPNHTDKPKISFVYTVRGETTTPIKGTRSDAQEIKL
ncbi:Phytanoyl-CoA dioxygenase [hydrothermal vent metagenome]|uniref:Phytanoyl-CoA dioxygenase n=1 Tax=hydrothermal vent metagenome TaxID=652676 RepID=A0A1W1EJ48_9ZZZZ